MSTVKAAFGRWVPLVHLDHATSIPCRFVLKLSDQFRPTDVTDGFRQTVVLDHVLDLQTLDADDLVFAYDASREFMLIVSSPICNLFLDASNLQTSFCTVLRTFFLFCMTALCFCQLLCIFGEELGIAIGLPIRGDDHRLQAQIKPNHLRSHFQGLDLFFCQDGDKIAVSFILGDRDAAGLASIRQGTMPHHGKRGLHLRQRESLASLPIPGKSIARIGGGLLMAFLFEGGILRTPFKEVAKGLIKMSKSLLERNRGNRIEPHRLFLLFQQDQTPCGSFVVQTLPMLVVGVSALPQGPVVDIAATSEGLRQDAFLCMTWIEAILVGFLLFHPLQYSMYAVKCQIVTTTPLTEFTLERSEGPQKERAFYPYG